MKESGAAILYFEPADDTALACGAPSMSANGADNAVQLGRPARGFSISSHRGRRHCSQIIIFYLLSVIPSGWAAPAPIYRRASTAQSLHAIYGVYLNIHSAMRVDGVSARACLFSRLTLVSFDKPLITFMLVATSFFLYARIPESLSARSRPHARTATAASSVEFSGRCATGERYYDGRIFGHLLIDAMIASRRRGLPLQAITATSAPAF